jgi:tripartite-type tricarboxylate transporter receptor subunit TctC
MKQSGHDGSNDVMRLRSMLEMGIPMAMPRRLLPLIAALLVAFATTAVAAQDYPSKPVRIIVPFAPGGLNDVIGRLIGTHLSERLGKKFVVENRTGAGGVVGSEIVAQAPKDGYTLLIVSIAHTVHPSLNKLSYDGRTAFAPIAYFAGSPNALGVNRDLPVNTLGEFITLAKAKPGELQYASGGVGGSLHLHFELFKSIAGIDVLHVPFRGATPAIIDVIGGHSKAVITTVATLSQHVRGGKIKALAVSGQERNPTLPDVPTFAESKVPYSGGNWMGLAAPAGTPETVIALLHKEIAEIQKLPDVRQQMANQGAVIETKSVAEFTAFMEHETAQWARIIKERGIQPQ